MTAKVKAYAKVNLTLDVGEKVDGYHELNSIVATVDIYDVIKVVPRRDDKIVLKTHGGFFDLPPEQNNAYKAAELFKNTFNTKGVTVTVYKNIPVGAGLGGSSADVAGVLRAMKKAFAIDEDVKPLADELSSDGGYQLSGGLARLRGRGTLVTRYEDIQKLHFVVAFAEGGVSTAECFKFYDDMPVAEKSDNDGLIAALLSGNVHSLKDGFSNMLAPAAFAINPEIKKNYDFLSSLSPIAVNMTGSGSAVFALFESKELCEWAAAKAKVAGINATVATTVGNYE